MRSTGAWGSHRCSVLKRFQVRGAAHSRPPVDEPGEDVVLGNGDALRRAPRIVDVGQIVGPDHAGEIDHLQAHEAVMIRASR
ncbi:MAG: hypothetical protein AMXMBFR13_14400 [Phycisphaerae bacterium]